MKIAVVGSYGVGLTMRVPDFPRAGETILGGQFSTAHGGKGSNQAVAAARLGATVSLFTAVGNDEAAQAARALWSDEHIDATHVRTVSEHTMTGMILVEESGENRIIIAEGALESLRVEHLNEFKTELETADCVIVSLEIPLDVAFAALEIAHNAGVLTILNPAPAPGQKLPSHVWKYVDIVTPNATEMTALTVLTAPTGASGNTDLEPTPENEQQKTLKIAQLLNDMSGSIVVATRGENGSIVVDETGVTLIPAVTVERVVDTTGAGDAFTAGLAIALCEKKTISDAARFASKVASHTVSLPEVIASLPYRHELDEHTHKRSADTSES